MGVDPEPLPVRPLLHRAQAVLGTNKDGAYSCLTSRPAVSRLDLTGRGGHGAVSYVNLRGVSRNSESQSTHQHVDHDNDEDHAAKSYV